MSVDGVITWARLFGAGRVVELWSSDVPPPARGQRGAVPICWPGSLADAPLHLPLEMLALGVADVRIAPDPADTALESRIEQWRTLFALVGRELGEPEPGKAKRDVLSAEAMPTVQRRSLFGLGGRTAEPAEPTWEPDRTQTEHQRLRSALRELAGDQPLVEVPDDAPGPGVQLAADGCTAQGQCVQACPQGALQLTHTDAASTLHFDVSLCDGCRRCIEFCDQRALTVEAPASWSTLLGGEPAPLTTVVTRTCERCRVAFHPEADETLCPVCAMRRANPFGSTLPPEAIERLRRMREQQGPMA